jgi:hypothetical protein
MSDAGMSDVMQSVDVDSYEGDSGGYEEYSSDESENDYTEQDEYIQIEEKVSSLRHVYAPIMHASFLISVLANEFHASVLRA